MLPVTPRTSITIDRSTYLEMLILKEEKGWSWRELLRRVWEAAKGRMEET